MQSGVEVAPVPVDRHVQLIQMVCEMLRILLQVHLVLKLSFLECSFLSIGFQMSSEDLAFSNLASCCKGSQALNSSCIRNLLRISLNPQN